MLSTTVSLTRQTSTTGARGYQAAGSSATCLLGEIFCAKFSQECKKSYTFSCMRAIDKEKLY
jgi:hypothetical protein